MLLRNNNYAIYSDIDICDKEIISKYVKKISYGYASNASW